MEDPKLTAIRGYLNTQYPGHSVRCFEDKACAGWLFRIDDTPGHPVHWLIAENDFLKEHTVQAIDEYLREHQIGSKVMAARPGLLHLTNDGPRVQGTP